MQTCNRSPETSHPTSSRGICSSLAGDPGALHSRSMSRIDSASRLVQAAPARVFAALVDPAELLAWLPPHGMTGRFEWFDARPGGSYRLILTYDEALPGQGKTTSDSDVVEARFTEISPDERVRQEVDFVSDDPAFAGTMTLTWELSAHGGGTRVEVRAGDVPSGIAPEDHAVGLGSSLSQLAAVVEDSPRR